MNSKIIRFLSIILLLFSFCAGSLFLQGKAAGARNQVFFIQLNDDTINPITAEFISHAIDQAEEQQGQCLILQLDTPGGLLASTRQIVKRILAANIPIVVYIAPSGSRAGSAGVFITYASHIAVMAPSTNIGAAHPVQMGGGGRKGRDKEFWEDLKEMLDKSAEEESSADKPEAGQEGKEQDKKEEEETAASEEKPAATTEEAAEDAQGKTQDTEEALEAGDLTPDENPMDTKILQDTVAFIRALAKQRGRNVDWAIKSVTKSFSVTETEALDLDVIDFIARDETELLEKLDGTPVDIRGGTVTLNTKDASVVRLEMNAREKFFNILANPNIAYFLLILGFYGLLYEVTHPGFGVPGIMGTIFLILAFYSMQTLPTNYTGLALLVFGLALLVAEAFVPGFGVLTAGGIISMFLGSILLFDSPEPIMRVSLPIIISMLATTAFLTIFMVHLAIKSFRKKAVTGQEGMRGAQGVVKKKISGGQDGKVFVHGELWNAVSDEPLEPGDKIIVEDISGLTLKVKKAA